MKIIKKIKTYLVLYHVVSNLIIAKILHPQISHAYIIYNCEGWLFYEHNIMYQ